MERCKLQQIEDAHVVIWLKSTSGSDTHCKVSKVDQDFHFSRLLNAYVGSNLITSWGDCCHVVLRSPICFLLKSAPIPL